MNTRRVLPAAAAAGAGLLLLSSCSELPEGSALGEDDELTACMLADEGGFEDLTFNQEAHDGFGTAARDAGIPTREAAAQSASDYEPSLRAMVQSGCGLTVVNGVLLTEATRTVAEDSPQARFAIIDDGSLSELDNVKPLTFDSASAAFLAGYIAAGTTQTGTVAAFGGMDVPRVTSILDGFSEGIEHWNEENDGDVELLGWDRQDQEGAMLGSFSDVEAAGELTQDFLDDGADIILPVAGGAAQGTAQTVSRADPPAGSEGHPLFIWVDVDGYDILPEDQRRYQLTSVLKDITGPVEDLVSGAADGEFDTRPYVGTLENRGVGIADYHDQSRRVGQDLSADVARLRQEIIDGDLTVESREDSP